MLHNNTFRRAVIAQAQGLATRVVGLDSFVLSNIDAAIPSMKAHLNLSSLASLCRMLSERGYSRHTTRSSTTDMAVTFTRGKDCYVELGYYSCDFRTPPFICCLSSLRFLTLNKQSERNTVCFECSHVFVKDEKAAQAARHGGISSDRRRSDSTCSTQGGEIGGAGRKSSSKGSPASESNRFPKRIRSPSLSPISASKLSDGNTTVVDVHSRLSRGNGSSVFDGSPRSSNNADRRRNRDSSSGVSMIGGRGDNAQKRPRVPGSSDSTAADHRSATKATQSSIDSHGVFLPTGTHVETALPPGAVPQTSVTMSTFLDAALLEPWPLTQLFSARSAYAQQQCLRAASDVNSSSFDGRTSTTNEPLLGDACSAPVVRNSSWRSRRSGGDAPAAKDAAAAAEVAAALELPCPSCGVAIALDAVDDDPNSSLPVASLGCDFCPETVLCTRTPQCFALHQSKYLALSLNPPPAAPSTGPLSLPAAAMNHAWISWARDEGPRAVAASAGRNTTSVREADDTTLSTNPMPSSAAQSDEEKAASVLRVVRPSAPLDASTWHVRSRYGWACPHCWAEALQRSHGWESQHQQHQLRQEAGHPWTAPRTVASSRGGGSSGAGSGNGGSSTGGEVTRRSSRGMSYMTNADMRDFFEESDQLLDQLVVNRNCSGQSHPSRTTAKSSDNGDHNDSDDDDGDNNDGNNDNESRSDDKKSTSSKRSESDSGGNFDVPSPKMKKKKKGQPSFASLAAKGAAEAAANADVDADAAAFKIAHAVVAPDATNKSSVDSMDAETAVNADAEGCNSSSMPTSKMSELACGADDAALECRSSSGSGNALVSAYGSTPSSRGNNRRALKPIMQGAISLRETCSEGVQVDSALVQSTTSVLSTRPIETLESSLQDSAAAARSHIGDTDGSEAFLVPLSHVPPLVDLHAVPSKDFSSSMHQPETHRSGQDSSISPPRAFSVSRSVEF